MSDKIPFQVLIDSDLLQKAKAIKDITGSPISEMIRRGLEEYIARKEAEQRVIAAAQ